jgi:nucleotide-binding universal stress UspA family protein
MALFQKILCPVDFFKTSNRAFEYGLKLASHYGANLHVLHAVSVVIPAAYGAPITAEDMTSDLEKESKRQLAGLKARAAKAGVTATTEVSIGDVDVQILRVIKKQKADLVVMGSHGRRGFERLILGSTTERMIRVSPVPILIVGLTKGGRVAPPAFRRILMTTDFSAGTSSAAAAALSVAQECQAKVTLLHVVNDLAADVSAKYMEPLLRGVSEELNKLVPNDARDWCDVTVQVETGVPHELIPKILKQGKYDLLVMNIHGKSLLDRALLGSTAERTLRAATETCPVLLIPPPAEKARARRRPKR